VKQIAIFFMLTVGSSAQPIGFGLKGGVPLTDAFSDRTIAGPDSHTRFFSDSKGFIVGAMVELRLPYGLAVEVDALYRRINLSSTTTATTLLSSLIASNSTGERSWEFPILPKYRFYSGLIRPYMEAGPSFRNTSVSGLSGKGFTLGGGVEAKALIIRLSPELRYTRWGSDSFSNPAFSPRSGQNQIEFLVGLSF
jgi:hypothetical protein